jgi:hypothetical protein
MRTKFSVFSFLLSAAVVGVVAGCGSSPSGTTAAGPSPEGAAYRLATEPPGATTVKDARANAKNEDKITLVGRIGGDVNPWIEGQAAFLVVDTSLKPCNEMHDDACKTPWDYCCDAGELPAHKALVKFVDGSGKPVATDARKLLGVKELQTVVVHGIANRDEAGNLTVLADGVFVRN